jgi:hypothetical protein
MIPNIIIEIIFFKKFNLFSVSDYTNEINLKII